jgi:CheY-like chemotaxis protein/HPt (histidine-containing phosphotransfer) domain-containing protein
MLWSDDHRVAILSAFVLIGYAVWQALCLRATRASLAELRKEHDVVRRGFVDVHGTVVSLQKRLEARRLFGPGLASTPGGAAGQGSGDFFDEHAAKGSGGDRESRPTPRIRQVIKLSAVELSRLRGHRVLAADDGPGNRYVMQRALSRAGIHAEVVEDGRLAVDRALSRTESERFDVILLDLSMPVLDGFEAAREIRAKGLSTPILGLTSNELDEERSRARAAGCDDILHKPVERDALLRAILERIPAHSLPSASPFGEEDTCETESTSPTVGSIPRSVFADDEDMTELIDWFTQDLCSDIERIDEALDQGDLEELGRIAHHLRGSGGSYGFPLLTRAASRLESAVLAGDEKRAREKAKALVEACAKIAGA